MPIELHFEKQHNFLHVKASGQIGLDDFKSTVKTIHSSNDYPPDIATLWNLQDLDFSMISSRFVKSLIGIQKKYSAKGKIRFALLVSSQIGAAFSTMYKSLSGLQGLPHDFEVFQNIDDAKGWLTVDKT